MMGSRREDRRCPIKFDTYCRRSGPHRTPIDDVHFITVISYKVNGTGGLLFSKLLDIPIQEVSPRAIKNAVVHQNLLNIKDVTHNILAVS